VEKVFALVRLGGCEELVHGSQATASELTRGSLRCGSLGIDYRDSENPAGVELPPEGSLMTHPQMCGRRS
jgi:hypothetical protein